MSVRSTACLLLACVFGLSPSAARADEPGRDDLDRAIAEKLSADTFRELGEVADLCQSALKKGLEPSNAAFAKQILAGTLLERASAVCTPLLGGGAVDEQWPMRRRVALEDLERVIECDPRQPLAQLMVAQLQLLPGGNREQALSAVDAAIDLSGEDPPLKAEALRLRAGLGTDAAARLADLDEAVRLTPADPKPLRERGELRIAMNQAEAALTDFDAALTLEPLDAATHVARGIAQGILRNWDEARASFTRAIELAPDATIPYIERGRVSVLSGDVEAALADAAAALANDPNDVAALHFRAQVLASSGKLEQALEDINRLLVVRPGFVEGLRIWASLIVMTDKVAPTIAALERRSQRRPDDPLTFVRLGLLYAAQRRHREAIAAYDAVIQRVPDAALVYQGRGDAYLSLGKQREAIDDFDRALKLEPNNNGVLNNLAWVLATSPDASLRDGRRAIELATKACELTEYRLAHILSTLAAGYAEVGDFDTAQRYSGQAVELGDDSTRSQLAKELESYKSGKPWRELQSGADEPPQPPVEKSVRKNGNKPR